MELLGQILFEFIIGGGIFYPGTYILWLFSGRKKKFREYYENKPPVAYVAGIIFWVLLILIITIVNR